MCNSTFATTKFCEMSNRTEGVLLKQQIAIKYLRLMGLVLLALCIDQPRFASAQGTEITVSVDLGEGLIYFLVILFFGLNFGTPVARWLYSRYLSRWVEKASKEISKASKRFTERMSDVSRRATQSIRVETK